jgi:hypothetical protein
MGPRHIDAVCDRNYERDAARVDDPLTLEE